MEKLTDKTWKVTKDFLEDKFGKDCLKVPGLEQTKFLVAGFDYLFNNKGIAESRMQVTILYIIYTDVMLSYQDIRDNYINNRTEDNAKAFINAYQEYLAFIAYASEITNTYLGERFVEGANNQLAAIINPDNDGKVTYEGFSGALNANISNCESLNNLISGIIRTYNTFAGNPEISGKTRVTGVSFAQKEITVSLSDYLEYPIPAPADLTLTLPTQAISE